MSTRSLSLSSTTNTNGLAPPPNSHAQEQLAIRQPPSTQPSQSHQSQYATSIAKSMTIDEMRDLHRRALAEAESKQMELRLVLASRYRELVGSSDEVQHMQKRAHELDEIVQSLPSLLQNVFTCAEEGAQQRRPDSAGEHRLEDTKDCVGDYEGVSDESRVYLLRRDLLHYPRVIHRCLDRNDVHGAAIGLIQLFKRISGYTDVYPLANALASTNEKPILRNESSISVDQLILKKQMKMVYLHVQTLPARTVKISKQLLLQSSHSNAKKFHKNVEVRSVAQNGSIGAKITASAMSALDLLDVQRSVMTQSSSSSQQQRAVKLVDLYFDSKAKLIHGLLSKLTTHASSGSVKEELQHNNEPYSPEATDAAEEILSEIVLILQHDVILHPYQIFLLRRFQVVENEESASQETAILSSLPPFDRDTVKTKASHFLALHLPLIRNKVKSVLITIAGTTASRLGQIRQSLYDKTDGFDCRKVLDSNGLCTWEDAIAGVVDVRIANHGAGNISGSGGAVTYSDATNGGSNSEANRKFSLWSTLFSNTFSSLVHSLLTSSFHSVHSRVVATLRASLTHAPPLAALLPHEAYRNTLRITTELDAALKKVSDDAYELLVHAEEREESERRLRQSLYVQSCEIMGRLLNELRRMLLPKTALVINQNDVENEEATRELIVGRLCHLLKFRLTSLPTLLDHKSSTAFLTASTGVKSTMITVAELRSAFEIADDDDDGLISFNEAMEAMEGAFSGTQFHGAEMVRDTLLLASAEGNKEISATSVSVGSTPQNVTLSELALLSARGLRHDSAGPESALGTIQRSLDSIIHTCFAKWARVALTSSRRYFLESVNQFVETASNTTDSEWRRLHQLFIKGDNLQFETEDSVGKQEEESARTVFPIDKVSSHVVSYLLYVTFVLNQSVCPSDALPPVPSLKHASALGIYIPSDPGFEHKLPLIYTIRGALLRESLISMTDALEKGVKSTELSSDERESSDSKLNRFTPTALAQFHLDATFVSYCFFTRNVFGFMSTEQDEVIDGNADEKNEGAIEYVEKSKAILESISSDILSSFNENDAAGDVNVLIDRMKEKHKLIFNSCDLFLSSLFGEEKASEPAVLSVYDSSRISSTFQGEIANESQASVLGPLSSSRRFVLLPIQTERSISELQLLDQIGKDKEKAAAAASVVPAESTLTSSSAVSSGFGFFSSMLKKK